MSNHIKTFTAPIRRLEDFPVAMDRFDEATAALGASRFVHVQDFEFPHPKKSGGFFRRLFGRPTHFIVRRVAFEKFDAPPSAST